LWFGLIAIVMMEKVLKNEEMKTSYSNEYDAECKTESPTSKKYSFLWTIEKFSELTQKPGDYIETCDLVYKGSGFCERKWKLKLYPNGLNLENEGKLCVYLCNESDYEYNRSRRVTATFEISVLDKFKTRHNTVKGKFTEGRYGDNAALKNFAVKSFLGEDLLPDDTLSIVCYITEEPSRRSLLMTEQMKSEHRDPIKSQNHNPMILFSSVYHKELVKDMNNVFTDKDNGYNVTINCGDQIFYCHKFMLSARSPVFKAMFQSDMLENKSGSVEVGDIHPNVMIEMLRYIYSGCTLAIEIYGRELLAAADKYQLDKLKIGCEEYLCGTFDVENWIDLLLLGESNQAKTLKKAALEFFAKNLSSSNSGDWKIRLKDHPILAIEVMEWVLAKKN